MHIGIRWFAGFRLHEQLPHHSSLTRLRQRWGPERFKRIFQKTVQACVDAGLVDGDTVHVDATLIRADVSWESLVEQHAEKILSENDEEKPDPKPPGSPRKRRAKRISKTDPEATLTTSKNSYRMEPSFKQHTAVDDKAGVVVDVEVTTGEASEGRQLVEQIERTESNTNRRIETVTADAGYAHPANYAALENRKIEAIIPPQKESHAGRHIRLRRFKYDARNDIVRCPRGKILRKRTRQGNGWIYRSAKADCATCPIRAKCFSNGASRTVLIVDGYGALLRARRRRKRWSRKEIKTYNRHRWRVEGIHGEAKTQHRLGRAVRRGLGNVAIQAYLTAAVINLKRLVGALLRLLFVLWRRIQRRQTLRMESTIRFRQEPSTSRRANWLFKRAA